MSEALTLYYGLFLSQARAVLINAGQANAATVSLVKLTLLIYGNLSLSICIFLMAEIRHCHFQGDAGYQDVLECADAIAKVWNCEEYKFLIDRSSSESYFMISLMPFFSIVAATQNKAA